MHYCCAAIKWKYKSNGQKLLKGFNTDLNNNDNMGHAHIYSSFFVYISLRIYVRSLFKVLAYKTVYYNK